MASSGPSKNTLQTFTFHLLSTYLTIGYHLVVTGFLQHDCEKRWPFAQTLELYIIRWRDTICGEYAL